MNRKKTKDSAQMIGFVKQVMEVGEQLSAKGLIDRLLTLRGTRNPINNNTITMRNTPIRGGVAPLLRSDPMCFEKATNPHTQKAYQPIVWRRIK